MSDLLEALSGGVSGGSRAELTKKAREVAALYFGTRPSCVAVRLADAQCEKLQRVADGTLSGEFSAAFDALEDHRVETPSYGFPKCRDCERESNARDSLPRANWGMLDAQRDAAKGNPPA